MGLQQYPICFDCTEAVEHSPVFEAPCGHDGCPSSVFHGICLMSWRDKRQKAQAALMRWLAAHEEHSDHRPRPN